MVAKADADFVDADVVAGAHFAVFVGVFANGVVAGEEDADVAAFGGGVDELFGLAAKNGQVVGLSLIHI